MFCCKSKSLVATVIVEKEKRREKMTRLLNDMENVRTTMTRNIVKGLANYGTLSEIETKAEHLVELAREFKRLANHVETRAKRSLSKIIHFKVESFDSSGSTTIFKCETTIIDGNGQRRSVPSEKRYSSILEQHRIVGKGLSFPPKKYCGSMKKCFVERRKNQLNAYFRKLLKRYSNLQTNEEFIEWCFADTTSSCACLKIFR